VDADETLTELVSLVESISMASISLVVLHHDHIGQHRGAVKVKSRCVEMAIARYSGVPGPWWTCRSIDLQAVCTDLDPPAP